MYALLWSVIAFRSTKILVQLYVGMDGGQFHTSRYIATFYINKVKNAAKFDKTFSLQLKLWTKSKFVSEWDKCFDWIKGLWL